MSKKTATFRFYEELNDFLPKNKRKLSFEFEFMIITPIKDAIESLGVPHSEVDLILVNGRSVNFNYMLQDQDKVSVYPVFEKLDISSLIHLRPKPLRNTKFILDAHLGRLCKYLRMCGFDSVYYNQIDDAEVIDISLQQRRIILTKDRGLLKNKKVTHGYWIREERPLKQLVEVINYLDLSKKINFLTRCLLCNSKVVTVSKNEMLIDLPQKTIDYYDEFFLCQQCGKIYWKGSHYKNMLAMLELFQQSNS